MAFRIESSRPVTPKRKPVKDDGYLNFVRKLPCLITLKPAEAAHVSMENSLYGHAGRGKGQKASDRWAVPLSHQFHMRSHEYAKGEIKWWIGMKINPYIIALILHGIYTEAGMVGLSRAEEVCRNARSIGRWG